MAVFQSTTDGGGLRLTVAEYLTPALKHVTNVGRAQFDQISGERMGGGIYPDIVCQGKQGIPANVGADLCVGLALDALDEADTTTAVGQPIVKRVGGSSDGSQVRRSLTAGILKVRLCHAQCTMFLFYKLC
jgi:hypothetical protein